jgi:hypothetical protein
MLRRLGALAGAAVVSLTLAASAQAAPTAPVIKPFPAYVCGSSQPISWSASTPDPGATIVGYQIYLSDLTAGTLGSKGTPGLSTTLTGLITNHHYVVRVRAIEYMWSTGHTYYSATAARTFQRTCLIIAPERFEQYVAYNPDPGCIMCDVLEGLQIEDPVIYKSLRTEAPISTERYKTMVLEADGSVSFM